MEFCSEFSQEDDSDERKLLLKASKSVELELGMLAYEESKQVYFQVVVLNYSFYRFAKNL